jgi:hypothetical protein
MSELWWCVKSPQYGLLPFTAHTTRREAILRFQLHGLSVAEQWAQRDKVPNGWRIREG